MDKPDGWVSHHYRGVVWGYVFTILILGWLAYLLFMVFWRASAERPTPSDTPPARFAPPVVLVVCLIAVFALPIGKRPGANTSDNLSNSTRTVPRLVGLPADQATQRLDDRDLDSSFDENPTSDEHDCLVVSQTPDEGAQAEESDDVKLRCESPIPDVTGTKANSGESRIEDAGFTSEFTNEPSDLDYSRCRVKSQSRTTSAQPNATIRLKLHCTAPKQVQTASSSNGETSNQDSGNSQSPAPDSSTPTPDEGNIPNYNNGNGYRVQCADGMYSQSGGIQGACSGHGGVR